jgi:hypothetical protein
VCCKHSGSAAWLTGGKVDKIEVYENEGTVPAIFGLSYVNRESYQELTSLCCCCCCCCGCSTVGGVAHFRGGIRACIIPAGYVGVSFWAGVFVALSGSRVGATVSASIFLLGLLLCLT